jgi:hypothetical protein
MSKHYTKQPFKERTEFWTSFGLISLEENMEIMQEAFEIALQNDEIENFQQELQIHTTVAIIQRFLNIHKN